MYVQNIEKSLSCSGKAVALRYKIVICPGIRFASNLFQTFSSLDGAINLVPGCSKLTTSLVNVLLKFQTLNLKYSSISCRKNREAFALQNLL